MQVLKQEQENTGYRMKALIYHKDSQARCVNRPSRKDRTRSKVKVYTSNEIMAYTNNNV